MKNLINNRLLRMLVAIVSMFFPWILKRKILNLLLGYHLSPTAWIGFSIVSVSFASMEEGSYIGHLNVCRGLKKLKLGSYARIGNLNWIVGNDAEPLFAANAGGPANVVLTVGAHGAITNRHYIDCSGGVKIGGFTTVAGIRSQILTHSINLESNIQQVQPVEIGDYCFVGTGSIILPGGHLPNFSILGAGSLLQSKLEREWTLYAGVPAKIKKGIPDHYRYFYRETGFVD